MKRVALKEHPVTFSLGAPRKQHRPSSVNIYTRKNSPKVTLQIEIGEMVIASGLIGPRGINIWLTGDEVKAIIEALSKRKLETA
jgi:hypothetical protein